VTDSIRPTLGSVGRKFGNPSRPVTVNTPALVIGDWAAHPTGEVYVLACEPQECSCAACGHDHSPHLAGICVGCPCEWRPAKEDARTFVEWAVSHVPTGYRPAEVSLAWYHALRLAALLDAVWPVGTPMPGAPSEHKANSATFRAALAACQVEQVAESISERA
jgi:hypothetical protein